MTVAGVDFDRSVKFQFSSAEVEFDALQVNGETLTCASDLAGTAMSDCSGVDNGPNSTWPHVVTSTTSDDVSSSDAQTMEILVTSLPAEGGSFRVVKTVANGNWDNGTPVALEIGSNAVTVNAVDFVRSVKFQFSSGDIEFAELTLNGETVGCESGSCVDADADGIATMLTIVLGLLTPLACAMVLVRRMPIPTEFATLMKILSILLATAALAPHGMKRRNNV